MLVINAPKLASVLADRRDEILRAVVGDIQHFVEQHVGLSLARARTAAETRALMRIPGVGPINALAYKTLIDHPHRFRHSKTVGAYLGLTSRRWQSGTSIDIQGHISKAVDGDVRHALYEAANIMLTRYRGFCSLSLLGRP